jgi:hypothetical protein
MINRGLQLNKPLAGLLGARMTLRIVACAARDRLRSTCRVRGRRDGRRTGDGGDDDRLGPGT